MNFHFISSTFFSILIILMCIIAFAIIMIMIGLAILFGCKVAQKVHDKDNVPQSIKDEYKPHKYIIGTFDSPKALIDYALDHDVYPDQIGIVNINGFAAAFSINKKASNYIELTEVFVDWDEIGYKRIMENLLEEKEG